MPRVAGCDPGTGSLDILILDDGDVGPQVRFDASELARDPAAPVRWLRDHGPFDLIAGPSGYGLPLMHAKDCGDAEIDLMTLVRADERGTDQGIPGFSALLRELCAAQLPVVFLPGVIHLPTVPAHRKLNRIDMGTPDKLCVAALALISRPGGTFAVVELGTAFTAILVVKDGQIVDGVGGTSGPMGWKSRGAWDGELAYLLSPLAKRDLFSGGGADALDPAVGRAAFVESVVKSLAGLRAVTPFEEVVISGRLAETEPELFRSFETELTSLGRVSRIAPLDGAWVKAAAQGAALLADGLAGGRHVLLPNSLRLPDAEPISGWPVK